MIQMQSPLNGWTRAAGDTLSTPCKFVGLQASARKKNDLISFWTFFPIAREKGD